MVEGQIINNPKKRRIPMKISQAISCFFDYHKMNSQKNTARSYGRLISELCTHFGDRELAFLDTEEIFSFLTQVTKSN
jgi:hypothetical protein